MKRWTNGLPGATTRLGAKWPVEAFPLVSLGCARIPMLARSSMLHTRGLIHLWTAPPATGAIDVVWSVACSHLSGLELPVWFPRNDTLIIERSDTASDVSVGFGHSSVRNRFAITSIAFAARQACSCALSTQREHADDRIHLSCFINAHATRALLLAKATVATFIGRRPSSPLSHRSLVLEDRRRHPTIARAP